MTEDSKHEIDRLVETETKHNLLLKAKTIIKVANAAIADRNKWIKAREEQKIELERIKSDVYKAFDTLDESAMAELELDVQRKGSRAPTRRVAGRWPQDGEIEE